MSPRKPGPYFPTLQERGWGQWLLSWRLGLITQRDWDPPKLSPWAFASLKPSCWPAS